MANEVQAVKHNHEHEVLPQADTVGEEQTSAWVHTHFHSHIYRQSQSQAYAFEHCHAHAHAAGTPKHALADLAPEDKARIKRLSGRLSWDGRLESLGIRTGAEISQVSPQEDEDFNLVVGGQTVALSAAEAASVAVEVQQ